MSSNIRLTKTCECCNTKFEARTITTRYCSLKCNSRAYKQAVRNNKLKTAIVKELVKPKATIKTNIDYTAIETKELLTITKHAPCLTSHMLH